MHHKPIEPNFLDRVISIISPKLGNERMAQKYLSATMQYKGAQANRILNNWVLGLETATPDPWELETLRNRSRDLNRNDPVASGATDTMSLNIVGQGLHPQSRIRAKRLGISEDEGKQLQRQAEDIWSGWCVRPDNANKLDFDEIQLLAIRKIIEDGETIAIPTMATDPWRTIKRTCELLEAERLTSDEDITGISFGKRGQPLTYSIRNVDEKGQTTYRKIPALDKKGRPKILHVFPTNRPGQQRGVPYFAPVLTYFKHLADYLEAEVVNMRVAACLAVFITKQDPISGALGQSTSTNASGQRIQNIQPGMVGYLNSGEDINVVDPKRPGDSFSPFIEGILRMIGMSLGLPYELLAKDFSKTNYSSARASLLEGRRMFMTWRSWFAKRFCQPFYELVLEEAYLRDMFECKNFYEFKTELTRAAWIGGAWGWVDPVKEVDSSRKAIDYGLSTLAEEAAGQGRDWEEILEQQQKENAKADELGIEIIRSSNNQTKEEDDGEGTKKE